MPNQTSNSKTKSYPDSRRARRLDQEMRGSFRRIASHRSLRITRVDHRVIEHLSIEISIAICAHKRPLSSASPRCDPALLVNALTALLTFASLIGYAVVYTLWLKAPTPQNIVIGGAPCRPAVLAGGRTNTIDPHALLLFLIIFAWTPPHSGRCDRAPPRIRQGDIPMLPVTHGVNSPAPCAALHLILPGYAAPFLTV